MDVRRFEAINEQICFICLRISKLDEIIINFHELTEKKDKETKYAFYEELKRAYDSLPRSAIKIMNAKVRQENIF